jgi:hypothetical protein
MHKSTKTHWEWTELAARLSAQTDNKRREGETLMERDRSGAWVKRVTVPQSWVNQGYVVEASAEQIDLF